MTQDLMKLVDEYAAECSVTGFVSPSNRRAAVAAAIDALTKDATRYHWLREHTMPKPLPMVRVQVMYQGQYILRDGPELDADVDNRIAAIAAQKEQI